jgi:hypothetical protein
MDADIYGRENNIDKVNIIFVNIFFKMLTGIFSKYRKAHLIFVFV